MNKKEPAQPQFDLDDLIAPDNFIKAAETEDELGCVLRMHLCLERLLDKFLKEMVHKDHKKYHPQRTQFGGKLSLAVAYGLNLSIAEAIYIINQIRNKFAHSGDTSLSECDLNNLANLVDLVPILPPKEEPPVRSIHIELCKARPGERLIFGKNGSRIDFVIICSSLLRRSSLWMVVEYVRRNPELINNHQIKKKNKRPYDTPYNPPHQYSSCKNSKT